MLGHVSWECIISKMVLNGMLNQMCLFICVCLQRVNALQLWRSRCCYLLRTLAPTSAAHRPRGGETYTTASRNKAQNRETKKDRAEAKPCTAALVLQGSQLRITAQAPNFSNVCIHARCRVRECMGNLKRFSLYKKSASTTDVLMRTSQTGAGYLAFGHCFQGLKIHAVTFYAPSWVADNITVTLKESTMYSDLCSKHSKIKTIFGICDVNKRRIIEPNRYYLSHKRCSKMLLLGFRISSKLHLITKEKCSVSGDNYQ